MHPSRVAKARSGRSLAWVRVLACILPHRRRFAIQCHRGGFARNYEHSPSSRLSFLVPGSRVSQGRFAPGTPYRSSLHVLSMPSHVIGEEARPYCGLATIESLTGCLLCCMMIALTIVLDPLLSRYADNLPLPQLILHQSTVCGARTSDCSWRWLSTVGLQPADIQAPHALRTQLGGMTSEHLNSAYRPFLAHCLA